MNSISRRISFACVLLALVIGQQSSWVAQAHGIGGILNSFGQVGNSLLGGGSNVLAQASSLVSKPLNGLLDMAGNNPIIGSYPMGPLNLGTNLMSGINTGANTMVKSMLEPISSALHITPLVPAGNTATYGGYGASVNPAVQAATASASAGASSSSNSLVQDQMAASAAANAMNYGTDDRAARIARSASMAAASAGATGAMLGHGPYGVGGMGMHLGGGMSQGAAMAAGAIAGQAQLAGATGALVEGSMGSAGALAGASAALGAASAMAPPIGMGGNPQLAMAAGAASGLAGPAEAIGAATATDNAIGAATLSQLESRRALAEDAYVNAQAEAGIAGADMVAHGLNNARSASLASNAYRQAKLAGARDRVNIAGTIQNSARISDAAIATHDTALKAEDSLMGSELAVDSAATVLDSDAAYIPPVTNSLLRSLPYGRLGIRNILPKPLTYPSVLLPDVWLNGMPVNYLTLPLRMLPYASGWGYGGMAQNSFLGAGFNGQQLYSSNGVLLNSLVFDPTTAYLSSPFAPAGSSIFPVLANGQVQALDEVAMADAFTKSQQMGSGQLGTYFGYGVMNNVPMLTGSVSDINLASTSTIGSTYPIGSALVIEPRDSYFQDYIDSASSRQNFDEREQ